jgi:hypothetical protein
MPARLKGNLVSACWSFTKAGYLDNPIPALFKERLFVVLSRLCPVRYCIVRHVGFLLGHGRAAGNARAKPHGLGDVILLLKRPFPWSRDMRVSGRSAGIYQDGALLDDAPSGN